MSEASPDAAASADSSDDAPPVATSDPDAARLEQAQVAYEAGDFRRVRELTAQLSQSEKSSVVAAASELSRRVGIDPVQVWVLAGCLLLFCGIVYVYFGR